MNLPTKRCWPTAAILGWLEQVLQGRFGVAFRLEIQGSHIHLSVARFPAAIELTWFPSWNTVPAAVLPCSHWESHTTEWKAALDERLPAPGVSSLPADLIYPSESGYRIEYDILGLMYWMLARCEEIDEGPRDRYDRFPTQASHAYRHGYLQRPIVDEWLHILRQVIERQWPELTLKPLPYSMCVSHDVDEPSRYAFKAWRGLLRVVAIEVLRQRNWFAPLHALRVRLSGRKVLAKADPANTFAWLMDLSERHGLTSAFYFICGRTRPAMDADYELEWPALRQLLKDIHGRGHEIGLHPSFETYREPELIAAESQRLRTICEEEGIRQIAWGGRMHYLRWSHPLTMRAWEQAGMAYDSTLGYADMPGFRCGTCNEYPAFDPVEGRMLNLRIRPLIAMEVTVMSPTYMGLGQGAEALAQFAELVRACRAVGGCFTLLWHNSNLSSPGERALYEQVLALGAVEANA